MNQSYNILLGIVALISTIAFFIGVRKDAKKNLSDLNKKHDDYVKKLKKQSGKQPVH